MKKVKKETKYYRIINSLVIEYIEIVKESLNSAANSCSISKRIDFRLFARKFEENLSEKIPVRRNSFGYLYLQNGNVSDISIALRHCEEVLDEKRNKIKEKLLNKSKDNIVWKGPDPYILIFEELWGAIIDAHLVKKPVRKP